MNIYFLYRSDPYGCFTNFADYGFIDDRGLTWKTSEHYYQAEKFHRDSKIYEEIRLKPTPKSAKIWAYANADAYLPDWESRKLDVMRQALKYKFTQNDFCRLKLKESGDATLIEASTKDSFWGYGPDGLGKNWLGKLLMELRAELFPKT